MRLAILALLLTLLIAYSASGQHLQVIDTRYYCINGADAVIEYPSIIQTTDKGFFFTGRVAGPGGGFIPVCPGSSGNPIMGKLDSLGNVEWIKNMCDTPRYSTTICQTPDGGYAINGGTYPWSSISIFRYDALGNYLWRRDYGKAAGCGTIHYITTPDHGFLLLGVASGIDSDITVNYRWPPIAFQPVDWVLIKLDSLGNKQWVRTLGTSDDDLDARVLCDGKNYYLVGTTVTKDHDCIDTTHPGPLQTIYTIKLDSAGNVLWSKAHGAGVVHDVLYDDRDHSMMVTGMSRGGFEFTGPLGSDDYFLMKLDTAGNYKWGRLYGTSDVEVNPFICKAPDNGYYLSGYDYGSQGAHYGTLVSIDSNGVQLQFKRISAANGGVDFYPVFPSFDNGYVVFGGTGAIKIDEGSGQNCPNGNRGSGALFLSKLQVWKLAINAPSYSSTSFTVYPNPARDAFALRFLKPHAAGTLYCSDAMGQVLYRQAVPVGKDAFHIATASWAKGVYTVCWEEAGHGPVYRTIVVQ